MPECPLCSNKFVGKVGSNQFYCWECCVEFFVKKDKTLVYKVCDDGTLLPYGCDENHLSARS